MDFDRFFFGLFKFLFFKFKELHGTPAKRRLTVGKIYAGLLVLENYRSYKQSLAKHGEGRPVRFFFIVLSIFVVVQDQVF